MPIIVLSFLRNVAGKIGLMMTNLVQPSLATRLLNFVNNTLFPSLKKLPVDASTPIKKTIVQTTFADANNYMKDGVLLRQVLNVIDELDLVTMLKVMPLARSMKRF